jgi:hypothetical protein
MKFKGFMRRCIGNGVAEFIGFQSEHFREVGVGYAPIAGMPVLEAHQLINKWNRSTARFVYWLE